MKNVMCAAKIRDRRHLTAATLIRCDRSSIHLSHHVDRIFSPASSSSINSLRRWENGAWMGLACARDPLRSFSLGIEGIRMAQAVKVMMDGGLLVLAGLCAARRVNPWILFATQFGTLVIMPGHDGQEDHAENEFLQGLPPLSSSTSEASRRTSTPRDHARYGLREGPYWRGSSHRPAFTHCEKQAFAGLSLNAVLCPRALRVVERRFGELNMINIALVGVMFGRRQLIEGGLCSGLATVQLGVLNSWAVGSDPTP